MYYILYTKNYIQRPPSRGAQGRPFSRQRSRKRTQGRPTWLGLTRGISGNAQARGAHARAYLEAKWLQLTYVYKVI